MVAVDMAGKRFGRLVVLRQGVNSKRFVTWICQCDCGLIVEVRGVSLRNGHTKSCGCLNSERRAEHLAEYHRKNRRNNNG
jgi:hypothetical protein